MRRLLLVLVCLAAVIMASNAIAAQLPGPSLALYDSPYYSCVKNYYVATTGSDSNSGTSPATPWLTLQHANNAGRSAGDCVNVAPGTYGGVQINSGGNLAASTGYVVYRCTTMDACTVNGTGGINGNAGFFAAGTGSASYVIIDGFTIIGNGSTYGVGVEFAGSSSGVEGVFGSHHDWVFNSVIRGFGQSGIAFEGGDYTYAIHNTIYDNANAPNCDNGAQGSGLADNSALDINYQYPTYSPTADDKKNPNPHIGSFVTGSTWFHKVYEWNVVYNNHVSPCNGSTNSDTDGNNIILDTFGAGIGTGIGNTVAYPDQTLIAFNVVYNAGGGGIHIFFSELATVANNTCYNNYIDPYNGGSARACLDSVYSYSNTYINNIAVAIAASHSVCNFNTVPYAMFNNPIIGLPPTNGSPTDRFSNNITYVIGSSCQTDPGVGNGDTYSCAINKCHTSPEWVNVGKTSSGTETTQPIGTNFALLPGSPAIGYGLTETYLPASSVDAGACSSAFKSCP